MKKMLVQTQLSNYTSGGKFILEADSGWQMVMGRCRVMLGMVPDLCIDIMCPLDEQVITRPEMLYSDLYETGRIRYLKHKIIPNALATRYDFDVIGISKLLLLDRHKDGVEDKYTHVYINDPMHLRHFKGMFYLYGGYSPKYIVHSHFIDNPESPKFPVEGSLWLGQVEAARRADYNFWQCESALKIFLQSMLRENHDEIVRSVARKSSPWDDGYSSDEMNLPIEYEKLRFNLPQDKIIVFVPNRVGGLGRSSDYTNCGKFLFEFCNELWKERQDFVVIAGNPSQKFSNDELNELCKPYVKLVDGTFTRNEYRYVARHSHIAVGLYNIDSYGGTAARECLELDCLPLWVNNYEYKLMAETVDYPYVVSDVENLSDTPSVLSGLIDFCNDNCYNIINTAPYAYGITYHDVHSWNFKDIVRKRCSYEKTTTQALTKMGLL